MKYLDYSKLAAFRARCFPDLDSEDGDLQRDYVEIVKFFGQERVDPSVVRVGCEVEPFLLHDPMIDRYAQEIAGALRAEGRLHDGAPAMKLVSSRLSGRDPGIVVQPTNYDLQAGTCFALDWPHSSFDRYGGTLRDYYRYECASPTVQNNPLAICLGVCGILMVEEGDDRFLLRVTRSKHLASLEGTVGPSVAGAVDFTTDCANLNELNDRALGIEIEEELNLSSNNYRIVPLAWGLELFRGERPQLFSLIRTPLDRSEVSARLESIPAGHREFESFDFAALSSDGSLSRQLLESLNFEGRANIALALEYLRS